MYEERIVGGILGTVTGDALGLPVQFLSREEVRKNPITGMRGGGAFNTPPGTFSDDGSLTLCLVSSLIEKGYDLNDIANRFVQWYTLGYMTPFNQAFDIGRATRIAMKRLIKGVPPLEAGPSGEDNNGNGSLMRILPGVIYFADLPDQELISKVCDISKITHGHIRSQLGCSLYALLLKELLRGESLNEAYQNMCLKAQKVFVDSKLEIELKSYKRLTDGNLALLREDEIKSSGYVVDTLEAAVWSVITTTSFKEAILKAVNLGLDTDTVGAVAGGIAGVYYGISGIPEEWLSIIVKYDMINELSKQFASILK